MKRLEAPSENIIEAKPLEMGRGVLQRSGRDLSIIAAGICVNEALAAAEILALEGIDVSVVDMASIKPLDEALILDQASKTGRIMTVENHSVIGGLGSAVAEVLADAGIGLPFKRIGIPDRFCEGGTTPFLIKKFGLDRDAITTAAKEITQQ